VTHIDRNAVHLPLPLRLYRPLHHFLTRLGGVTVLSTHPSIVVRNRISQLVFSYCVSASHVVNVPTVDGFDICVYVNDQAAASIMLEQRYDNRLCTLLRYLGTHYDTLIDIGANYGYFSLLAANIGKKAIAIEPNKALVQAMQSSIQVNHFENLQVLPQAIGNTDSVGYFINIPHLSSSGYIDTSTTTPSEFNDTIAITTLNGMLSQVSSHERLLVKVDVEGAELKVLSGGTNAFIRRSLILCEIWPANMRSLDDLVDKYNYVLVGDRDLGLPSELRSNRSPVDVLMVPAELRSAIQAAVTR